MLLSLMASLLPVISSSWTKRKMRKMMRTPKFPHPRKKRTSKFPPPNIVVPNVTRLRCPRTKWKRKSLHWWNLPSLRDTLNEPGAVGNKKAAAATAILSYKQGKCLMRRSRQPKHKLVPPSLVPSEFALIFFVALDFLHYHCPLCLTKL